MSEGEASRTSEADPSRAVVVGPGRVGLTLAVGLHAAASHRSVQLVGRHSEAPAFLTSHPGISYLRSGDWSPSEGTGSLEIFLTVPDRLLSEAARSWARRLTAAGVPVSHAFHASGARPPSVLEPLGRIGARLAVLHPLRAVPAPRAGGLAGAWFGIAGDGAGLRRARELAAAMGGRTIRIREGDSARYHGAAVLASNLLSGCLLLARRELASASEASPAEAGEALDDLARSALDAVRGEEGAEGITGPLARGDLETVARHLSALDSSVGDAYAGLTRALGRQVLSLEPDALARLEEVTDRAGGSDARTDAEEGED